MSLAVAVAAQPTDAQPPVLSTWLDRPLSSWNAPGTALPPARPPQPADEPSASIVTRCQWASDPASAGARTIASAGWVPFLHVDQRLERDDVEVVGGLTGADGMCRPMGFQLFVFVGGEFAGTLSPTPMDSRADGSAGAVRLSADTVTAEFARYQAQDALCCPSSRVSVTFRVDRSGARPVVTPEAVRTTRQ